MIISEKYILQNLGNTKYMNTHIANTKYTFKRSPPYACCYKREESMKGGATSSTHAWPCGLPRTLRVKEPSDPLLLSVEDGVKLDELEAYSVIIFLAP